MEGERPSVSKFNLYVTFIIPAQKWYGQNNTLLLVLIQMITQPIYCTFVV